MAEFTYGFNIKRDKRISDGAGTANNEKYIAKLDKFASANNIVTHISAVISSMKTDGGETVIENSLEENDMMTALKILRDMYGIVHYFVISGVNLKRAGEMGRFFKTFNKNIKVYFAVRNGDDTKGVLDLNAVDSVITVTDGELKKAKASVLKTEHIRISDSDAAALYAAAKTAKEAGNKRRNVLVMLSDECVIEKSLPSEENEELNGSHIEENKEQTGEASEINAEPADTAKAPENSEQ